MKRLIHFFFGTAFRKGASLLSVLTFFSYVLGLVRDRLFARTFGASRILDIYNAAFIVPDLLLNILVAGALTAAFVPVFTHLWSTGEHAEADRLATTMLHAACLTILIIGGLVFFAMPWIAPLVAPGFSSEEQMLLISVSRLMLLSPLIFAVSNTLGNILVSYEHFIGYGFSPILYNAGIIIGTVFFSKTMGIYGLAVGTILGALLHLSTRVVAIFRTPLRLKYPLDFKNPSFKKVLQLMIPKMVGQPVEQFIFLVFTNLASTLAAGSIAILSFARNFQSVPVSLFGIAFSTAVFSSLAQKVAAHDRAGFKHHFWETAKWLLLASGLSAAFFYFFSEFIIKIFLGGGRFSPDDIQKTGVVLAMFAFAIPAESMIHLIARGFYAFKDTLTVVMVSVAGLITTVLLAKLFIEPLGLIGLPLSYFIAITANVLILSFLLYRKYQRWLTSSGG